MKSGYIKHHRKELCSDIWQMPPLYNRVWQWLKLKAKWKPEMFPTPKRFGIHLNPGQLITSLELISDGVSWIEWGKEKKPNKKTVKTILDWLIHNDMISLFSNAKGTFIIITNWVAYNEQEREKVTENGSQFGRQTEHGTDHSSDDSSDHGSDTIKEVKEVSKKLKTLKGQSKNEPEIITPEKICEIYHRELPTFPKVEDLTVELRKQIKTRIKDRAARKKEVWWVDFFKEKIGKSDWLMKTFTPGLTWITKANNFSKIVNNEYQGSRGKKKTTLADDVNKAQHGKSRIHIY